MSLLWAQIALFLGSVIVPIVKKIFVLLGFTFVIYTGLRGIYAQLESLITSQLGTLPSDVISILGIMQIDTAFSLIFSAALTKLTLQGWSALTDRKRGVGY